MQVSDEDVRENLLKPISSAFQGVFYKRNGSIYFEKVDDAHAGRYACTPYNELGTDGSSPIINVVVQKPPYFILKPKLLYVTKIGSTVEMHCDARDRDGTHVPQITWVKVEAESTQPNTQKISQPPFYSRKTEACCPTGVTKLTGEI